MTEAEPKVAARRSGGIVRLLAVLLVLAAAGWGGWRAFGPRAQVAGPSGPQAVPVQVAVAATRDVPIYLLGLGTVQAANTVLLRSQVDGTIVRIAFTEGQLVKEGDLLAEIDPRPFQAALDQAQAKKAQDEAQLGNAKLDLGRYTQLADRAFASRQQLDTQTATVGGLTAQLRADQAAIDNAQVQLGYTKIHSPIDGRTGFRLVDQGNLVRAADGTGIVSVVQVSPIAAVFTLPEGELPGLNRTLAAGSVKVWALSQDGRDTLAEGTLSLVNNTVDMATGTIRGKAAFPNADGALWPGQAINARVLLRTLPGS